MSKIPVLTAVRIIPRESGFLNRRSGSRGEIFYDQASNTLRLFDGNNLGGTSLAKSDLSNVSNLDFIAKAASVGLGSASLTVSEDPPENPLSGEIWFDTDTAVLYVYYEDGDSGQWIQPSSNSLISSSGASSGTIGFSNIAVIGQTSVSAQIPLDTVNLISGSNVSITTNASTKSITINATATPGSTSNSFETIAVAGQNPVVAESATDTLTIAAGSGIAITTNASTDTVTITSTVTAGATAFTGLSDSAGATIDQIYLPAITALIVSNVGASAYRFDQYGTTNNPTVYAINGTTIAFKLNISGHPFLIQTGAGTNYNTGLIHVDLDGTVSTGTSAQGKTSGTLYWKIPTDISGGYRYQCSIHAPMVGSISIKNLASI
jgi:plastocyanin